MGHRSFLLIFITAFIGLEQVSVKKMTSLAKIGGTVISAGGAVSMALLRGSKIWCFSNGLLRYTVFIDLNLLSVKWNGFRLQHSTLIPSLSARMNFVLTLQAGIIALFLEPYARAWNLTSTPELCSCFAAGILGAGIQFFVQSWCILQRGPFYSAMFTPLGTVITSVLASIFLQEEIYSGCLLGAVAVIIGLYVVLWGKSEEMKERLRPVPEADEKISGKAGLEQSLLIDDPDYEGDNHL